MILGDRKARPGGSCPVSAREFFLVDGEPQPLDILTAVTYAFGWNHEF
jgi:hypothetical protein